MFSFACSDTTAASTASSIACSLLSKPRPVLVAGRDPTPAGRRNNKYHEDAQLIRLAGFKEEDIRLMKVMFDFYDRDRDGKLTPSQACLLCTTLGFHPVETSSIRCSDEGQVDFRQLVQSAGFVRANQTPPGARGGSTKHFYRMATRNASHSMTSEQVHRFFESIGVDIPQPAVDRITTNISSEGDTCLKENELVEYVDRIRRRQEAVVATQHTGSTRSQVSRNGPRGGARGR